MIQMIVTCDSCGKVINREVSPKEQLWYVQVLYREGTIPYQGSSRETVMWCRKCLEKTGLVPVIETPPEQVKKVLTMEEIVREIVQECLKEAE